MRFSAVLAQTGNDSDGLLPDQLRVREVSAAQISISVVLFRIVDLVMTFTDVLWPCAIDERRNGNDFVVGQGAIIDRHVALVVLSSKPFEPEFRSFKKQLVRMMPCMTGLVVRRRRQPAVGLVVTSVGLAFEIVAVAAGAVFCIDLQSDCDHTVIIGLQQSARTCLEACGDTHSNSQKTKGRFGQLDLQCFHGGLARLVWPDHCLADLQPGTCSCVSGLDEAIPPFSAFSGMTSSCIHFLTVPEMKPRTLDPNRTSLRSLISPVSSGVDAAERTPLSACSHIVTTS